MTAFGSYRNESLRALVFYFALSLPLLAGCFSRERVVLNATVLSVNGHELNTKEFAERLAERLKNFDALYAKDEQNLVRAKDEVVKTYILEMISRDYAKANGITVESKAIDDQISVIRAKYPDDFAFRRSLSDENITIEKFRSDTEFTLLQKKIFEKITADLPEPTEAEMKANFEARKNEFQRGARIRLRQIVLEKEDDAKRILDELTNGASLEKLAKQYSVAPEGANGGDTGWIEKGTLEVFDQAFKLKPGQRSKIVKSPYGYHIYEVLKKESETRLSFADAKARIRARLNETKSQQVFTAWLEERVRKSTVSRNDELIKAIRVTTK